MHEFLLPFQEENRAMLLWRFTINCALARVEHGVDISIEDILARKCMCLCSVARRLDHMKDDTFGMVLMWV
jgi:hypothetical protein